MKRFCERSQHDARLPAVLCAEVFLRENWHIKGLIFTFSAMAWVGSYTLNRYWLPLFEHTPGIDFVFIPSGVRLLVIMIGGIWAALGVGVGSLVLAGPEFNTGLPWIIVPIAVGSGLFPYAALRGSLWLAGVDVRLSNLSAAKLPLISLGVAVGSSALHNMLFSILGLNPWQGMFENTLTMATGDFIGILLAVGTVFAVLRLLRKSAV